MDLNKVMLIGRLTRDPELRTIPSGQTVASFSVATSRQWKDQQGQPQSVTEFHNVVAWRKLAEIVGQYLKKGKQVYIEGYLQTRSWDDQAGQKRYRTEIVADNMIMLGSAPSGAQTGAAGTGSPAAMPAPSAAPVAAEQAPAANRPPSNLPPAPEPNPDDEIRVEDIPF
ncbi:MAG: single-stranded DNA-binding protein [Patescibacteria group bacterium]